MVGGIHVRKTRGELDFHQAAGAGAEFIQVQGVSVHIKRCTYREVESEAPALIVLLHGFGASTFSWRHVMQPLSFYGDVIAYDRPGFGFTERPHSWEGTNPYGWEGDVSILDHVIEHYGNGRRVILVGHSAGGLITTHYALSHPVSGLVLVAPFIVAAGVAPAWLNHTFRSTFGRAAGAHLVGLIAPVGNSLLRRSFYDKNALTPEVYGGYHAPMNVKGWKEGFWNFLTAPRSQLDLSALSAITAPTLVISGDHDRVVSLADSKQVSDVMPNSLFEVIPRCGHLPHEERPAEFMEKISKHWNFLNGGDHNPSSLREVP